MSKLTEHWDQLALLHAKALPEDEAHLLRASLTDKDKQYLTSLDKVQKSLREYGKAEPTQAPSDVFERINTALSQQDVIHNLPRDSSHYSDTYDSNHSNSKPELITVIAEPRNNHHKTSVIPLKQTIIFHKKLFSGLTIAACFAIFAAFIAVHPAHKANKGAFAHQNTVNSEIFNFEDTNNNVSDPGNIETIHKEQARRCLVALGYPLHSDSTIISLSQNEENATILFHILRKNSPETVAVTVSSSCLHNPHKAYAYQEKIISGRTHN